MMLYLFKNGILFVLVLSSAFSLTPNNIPKNPLLSKSQKIALNRATLESNHYTWRAYSGTVSGQPKTVVILGEGHVKSEKDSNLGKEVMREFEAYGLEGAEFSKLWGNKLLETSMELSLSFVHWAAPSQTSHQSTIYDALEWAASENANHPENSKLKPIQVFHLEEGHEPSIGEHIESLILPILSLAQIAYVAEQIGEAISSKQIEDALEPLGTLGAFFAAYYGTLAVISKTPPPTQLVSWMELVKNRDRTMTRKTIQALEQNADQKPLLVIVGMGHVEGIGKLLQDDFNFKEIQAQGEL